MENHMITKEKCEHAILELSREPDKTYIYLSMLKRVLRQEFEALQHNPSPDAREGV